MKVSVVIPTYDRLDSLTRCLPAVLEQDFPADDYEVIVVVDGSTDGSIDYLHSLSPPCSLKVIEQQNRGSSAARNRGVAEASGDLILMLDDDNLVKKNLVRLHVEAHSCGGAEVVVGAVLLAPESPAGLATDLMRWSNELYLARLVSQGGPQSPFEVWLNSNCSMSRELFTSLGGCDEQFSFHGDDDDFTIRCWRTGARFCFRSDIVTYHRYSKTVDELIRDYGTNAARAEIVLCCKHLEYRDHSSLVSWIAGPLAKRFAARIVACAPQLSLGLLRGITHVLERKRTIPLARSLGVRVLSATISAERVAAAVSGAGSLRRLRKEIGLSERGEFVRGISYSPSGKKLPTNSVRAL